MFALSQCEVVNVNDINIKYAFLLFKNNCLNICFEFNIIYFTLDFRVKCDLDMLLTGFVKFIHYKVQHSGTALLIGTFNCYFLLFVSSVNMVSLTWDRMNVYIHSDSGMFWVCSCSESCFYLYKACKTILPYCI